MERFERFRFSVPAVPLRRGLLCVSAQFSREDGSGFRFGRRFRFRVRFLGKRFRRFRFPVPVRFLGHLGICPQQSARRGWEKKGPLRVRPGMSCKAMGGTWPQGPEVLNQESVRQTKAKNGRFASVKIGYFSGFGVFSLENQGEFTRTPHLREAP